MNRAACHAFATGAELADPRRKWDYARLSEGSALPWSIECIRGLRDQLDWGRLSVNPFLPWSSELLEAFEGRWVWPRLAANRGIPWNRVLVDRFGHHFTEEDPLWTARCRDNGRPIALGHGVEVLENGWDQLQRNPSTRMEEVVPLLPEPDWRSLSANPGLPSSGPWIEGHSGDLDLEGLSRNTGWLWTGGFLEAHQDGLDWMHLSSNPSLPWSDDLLKRFGSRWAVPRLARNGGIPWTVTALQHFTDRLDWAMVSKHGAITHEAAEVFGPRLVWGSVSVNRSIRWTGELVARHADRLYWPTLCFNGSVPWSGELIARFADRIVLEHFERVPTAWSVLAPHLDDDFVRAWLRAR